jgi:hypothetical protein
MQPFEIFKNIFFKQQSPKSKLCCLFCSFTAVTDKMGTVYNLELKLDNSAILGSEATMRSNKKNQSRRKWWFEEPIKASE